MPWLKRILAVGKIRKVVMTSHSRLEDDGYSIAYATDVESAMEMMESLKFDLIVLSHAQKRSIKMISTIKRRHPSAVIALIHPFPADQGSIVNLPPKSVAMTPDRLLSELRFVFESHSGPTIRRAG